MICTCTASEEALIGLKQVKKGVHINGNSNFETIYKKKRNFLYLAVGSYRETMCELANDLMLSSDTNIIVDSRESAIKEAGEIIQSKV